jgi:predicted nucleic acid-binding protein
MLAQLTGVVEVSRRVLALNLVVLPTEAMLLAEAIALSARHFLLTNDALIVAVMQRHGLVHLVTNDDDFDRVGGPTIWKPR